MIKVGIYLPVYGGWLPVQGAAKEAPGGIYFVGEEEEMPAYSYVRQVAIEAEKIGVSSLWIPDHMLNPIKGVMAPSLEAWTLAAAIAEATNRVNIVHTTLCEAFRYPAVLAKQASTLSEISNGRFWLSIGAGWFEQEYRAYGLPFYPHDERVARAKETIKIIKELWQRNNVTFEGKYYSITGAVLEPKPYPKPPIWYAGMSEASKEVVAEEADGWLMRGGNVEEIRKNISDMMELLRIRGRSKIEFAVPALTFIRDSDREAREMVGRLTEGQKGVLDRTLHTGLIGSPRTVAQKIRELEKIGINYIVLQLTPTLKELKNLKKLLGAIGEE